ncbi:MAG: hypothetical protein Q9199_005443 [Rusavskia elegans]
MSSSTEDSSILRLAESILENTKEITKQIQLTGTALPDFSPTAEELPTTPDFQKLQAGLSTQLEDLKLLIEGPRTFYRHFLMRGYEIAAFQIALDFDFFTLIPSEGGIQLEDVAGKSGLDQDRTGRVIRSLITHRFFQESRPGFFSHNSFSIALQKDDEMRSMVHYSFDEMLKASAEASVALKAHPLESDSVHCPFHARFGVPIFEYYGKYPENSGRFAQAMAGWRKMTNNVVELRDNYPWANLKGTVVDIGGGSGHVSIEMAKFFPHLSFAVQDGGDDMLAQGRRLLTSDVRSRISFTKANFFEPQPYKGACAYLIRQCTHNWADHDVVRIFKAIVAGLEESDEGTPLLINDMILSEPGENVEGKGGRMWERERRQADMVMLMCFGAKQRTVEEFKALLHEADSRFAIRKFHERGALGLIEVHLDRGPRGNNNAT